MPLAASDRSVKQFRAFADPTRLRLLALLRAAQSTPAGEICVCDLVGVLDSPQPTVSRHLAYLRRCGLVRFRREGGWSYYRLAAAPDPVQRKLLGALDACCAVMPELEKDIRRLRASGCCDGGCCT